MTRLMPNGGAVLTYRPPWFPGALRPRRRTAGWTPCEVQLPRLHDRQDPRGRPYAESDLVVVRWAQPRGARREVAYYVMRLLRTPDGGLFWMDDEGEYHPRVADVTHWLAFPRLP